MHGHAPGVFTQGKQNGKVLLIAGRLAMSPRRRELLTWEDVDKLIDHLLPQFEGEFTAMVMITRGGLVPGGMLAEAMGMAYVLTAAVEFPAKEPSPKKRPIVC